ncbi:MULTISPECIES: LacI family DNA-binding transcriptional regulator [unclassified Frondihabitans]|uniref:LacI family DNA-binding transcriptional regulator n=1 Tax=unclassified Frondihabitans TaxID=2626248 RepID=UPI000FB416CB|nr:MULTISPECIES: LacI family DNA-binding transcriptional regulator [unclassified Frondihabitans]RPE78062.1 LacI family transcriptional regulator [Frondihabitans sp. PhB153]RPF08342.1 LacI family transcriptional regulator [Frondihabitans sp. PhB161]
MRQEKLGIRSVAEAAGVSVTTVSHALNGRGKVSDKTRIRVQRIAAELGYAPNRIASALRSSRTNLIGFVSEEIATTPYAGLILVGAQEAAAELGLMLMIINVNRDTVEDAQIDALLAQQVDGLIFASSSHRIVTLPKRFDPARTVLVDAYDPGTTSPTVVPDEVGIGVLATRHLVEAGHRRILHLTVEEDVPAVGGREEGYRQVMEAEGLECEIVRVPGPADAAAGAFAIAQARRGPDRATAVFAFNDEMAMGVYQEVVLAPGITIPHDVSIVGVDDLRIVAAALRPGLTTVALPHAAMGRRAVELSVRQFQQDAPLEASVERLPGRLVERGSVAAPAVTFS